MSVLRTFLGGLAWKALSQLVSQAIRIVVLVVLAHLLEPKDYGLAGMALVFAALAVVLVDPGLGAAIVQRRELRPLDASTAHWMSTALGVLLAAAGVAAAPALASFYGESEVTALFAALSLGFVVSGLSVAPGALLTRAQAFRELELARIAGVVVGASFAIAVAAQGGGAWAIVAQQLSGVVTTTGLVWLLSPSRPLGGFSRAAFRDLGGFGARLLGAKLLTYVSRNGDNLLVGRYLGARALGFYGMAYNVILVPFSRVVDPVREVLFPIFARLQDDRERLASIWLRVDRVLAAFFAPAMLGLFVVAPDLVPTVLGERWEPAVPAVRLLALVALLQSLLPLNAIVLTVLDRTGTVFRISLVTAVLSVAGFVAGLPWGISGVAMGYLIATLVIVPIYTVLTTRALGLSAFAPLRALRGIAEAALAMMVVAALFRLGLASLGLGAAARLPLVIAVGILSYVAFSAWRARDVLAEAKLLWNLARHPVQ